MSANKGRLKKAKDRGEVAGSCGGLRRRSSPTMAKMRLLLSALVFLSVVVIQQPTTAAAQAGIGEVLVGNYDDAENQNNLLVDDEPSAIRLRRSPVTTTPARSSTTAADTSTAAYDADFLGAATAAGLMP